MPIVDRYLTKSFRSSEFRCRCRRPDCDAVPMDMAFMSRLQALRDLIGLPIQILSGSRCSFWNDKVCGAKRSLHLIGRAADISVTDFDHHYKEIVTIAEQCGMGGIGIASTFIHVDTGPEGRRWRY